MARSNQIPRYSVGTISIDADGNVTGDSTKFMSPDGETNWTIADGDILFCSGRFALVSAVSDDTHLTLDGWLGLVVPAGTAYYIRRYGYTPPGNAINGMLQQFLTLGTTSNPFAGLAALAGTIAKILFDVDATGTKLALKIRSASLDVTDSAYVQALTIDPATGALAIQNPVVAASGVLGMVKPGAGLAVAGDGTISGTAATSGALGMVKPDTTVSMSGAGLISDAVGFRNRIRNAQFVINQRGVSGTITLAAGAYGHDGVRAGSSGATYTFSQTGTDVTLLVTAGSIVLPVEGSLIEGGAYWLSQAGTAQARIWQGSGYAGSGSYAAPGFGATLTANTQTNVEFATGTVLRPQLEPGNQATVFERRPLAVELPFCERYFQTSYDAGTIPGAACNSSFQFTLASAVSGPGYYWQALLFRTKMRVAPTITLYSSSGAAGKANVGGSDYSAVMVDGFQSGFGAVQNSSSTTWGAGTAVRANWVATAEL